MLRFRVGYDQPRGIRAGQADKDGVFCIVIPQHGGVWIVNAVTEGGSRTITFLMRLV